MAFAFNPSGEFYNTDVTFPDNAHLPKDRTIVDDLNDSGTLIFHAGLAGGNYGLFRADVAAYTIYLPHVSDGVSQN